MPPRSQRYLLEFNKKSKKGCVLGSEIYNMPDGLHQAVLKTLTTNHEKGEPSCKAMGNVPIKFDAYKLNSFYFQLRID